MNVLPSVLAGARDVGLLSWGLQDLPQRWMEAICDVAQFGIENLSSSE